MEIKCPFSGQPISLEDQLAALVELDREVLPERLEDREGVKSDVEANKMLQAMSLFHLFAKTMAKTWNMKNHSVAFALDGVLKYWERR